MAAATPIESAATTPRNGTASAALVVPEPASELVTWSPEESERVGRYVAASRSPATLRAYRSSLRAFRAWCAETERNPQPAAPETVAAFIAEQADAGKSAATIGQRLAAIAWSHEQGGLPSPTAHPGVKAAVAGIRRSIGVAPKRQAAPLTVDRLAAVVAHVDRSTLKGKRDAALLLVGFASACRRSELAALDLADVEETDRGLLLTVRKSKSDQEGKGHTRAILPAKREELCPVAALRAWLEASGISEGRLFRSVDRHGLLGEGLGAAAVSAVVKQYAKRAGLDPKAFSGHSVRSGFITSAAESGATVQQIQGHTGHKSAGVVGVYVRKVSVFDGHPGAGLL